MTDTLRDQLREAFEKSNDAVSVNDADEKEEDDEVESAHLESGEETVENDSNDDSDDALEAPKHWAREDRETFRSLDAKGRAFPLRRHVDMETAYTKKQQALAEDQRLADNFKQTLRPYDDYLKQNNIDATKAVDKLLATEMRLRTASPHEKAAILNELAKHYGAQFDPNYEEPRVDSQTKLLQEELHKQRQYLEGLERQRIQNEERGYQNQINDFVNTKDANGKLKFEHFEDVRKDMGLLLSNGRAESLEDAYNKALFLNESLRDKVLMKKTKEEETRRRLASSKKASFNVKSSSSHIVDADVELSLRDTIAKAIDSSRRI